MAADTKIEWCDATFNPWIGCQRVSPGCENCYAEALDHRFGHDRWGPTTGRERTSPTYWRQPMNWNRRAAAAGRRMRVFCASMADVFEDRPELVAWRAVLFSLIAATPNLDWLLLTKRPENISRLWPTSHGLCDYVEPGDQWPNIWLGTTVEDQKRADERLPHLLRVPAAKHFVSCEPLLESVSLVASLDLRWGGFRSRLHQLNWIIAGGESGHGSRPFDTEWAQSLRRQARTFRAAFFMKQLGSNPVPFEGFKPNRTKHDRMADFPAAIRERAFP